MRDRTVVLLVLLVVIVALYGAKGLGIFLLILIGVPLLVILAVMVAFLLLRRRARRVLTAWERHMGNTFQKPPPRPRAPNGGEVIDVEPTDVRDATPPADKGR